MRRWRKTGWKQGGAAGENQHGRVCNGRLHRAFIFHENQNPWDRGWVRGGSRGGSAAALASGETIIALGTDTGGSIRQPASFCGVVGMKPTYGAVSRFGLIAFASSLDQVGPITKDVADCALVMNAICGHDRMDPTSVNMEYPDYTRFLIDDVKGFRIGIPREYMAEGVSRGVRESINNAIRYMKALAPYARRFRFRSPITPSRRIISFLLLKQVLNLQDMTASGTGTGPKTMTA